MIKALFFDLHKVITHGDFSDIYKNVAERAGITTEVVSVYHNQENLTGLLDGTITTPDMLSAFCLENKMTVKELLKVWEEETVKLMSVDEKMLSLLRQLRTEYTLAALTNLTEQRYGADIEMGLYSYFDYKVLSFEEGLKKPDPAYFKRALEITGNTPEEVIFIDDQEKNTAAAKLLGMGSITFTGYESLVKRLEELGVRV